MTNAQREAAFESLWNKTHSDFRGTIQGVGKTLISWAKFGGGLVSAKTITDAELIERNQ